MIRITRLKGIPQGEARKVVEVTHISEEKRDGASVRWKNFEFRLYGHEIFFDPVKGVFWALTSLMTVQENKGKPRKCFVFKWK